MIAPCRASLRILIVDDEPDSRDLLATAGHRLGHDCATAADGAQALALHRESPFDVIVSDWMMPVMSGLELCQQIRDFDGEEGYTFFVFTTGLREREHAVTAMRCGADDYLVKPIDLGAFEVRLLAAERLVGLHRRGRARTEALRRDSHRLLAAVSSDPLTRVGNRLRLDRDLAEIWRIEGSGAREGNDGMEEHASGTRAARKPSSMAMIDVDLFKLHNDRFGHLAGDDALRRIALAARAAVRERDAVYRYGGEEFAVLLPTQSHEEAAVAMERVRAAVEALGIAQPEAPARVVTVSIGIAELCPSRDASPQAWLKRADDALYRAKRDGRNRIAVDAHSDLVGRPVDPLRTLQATRSSPRQLPREEEDDASRSLRSEHVALSPMPTLAVTSRR